MLDADRQRARHQPLHSAPARHQYGGGGEPHQSAAAVFREQIPPSVNVDILLDRSEPILESVNDVKFTLC